MGTNVTTAFITCPQNEAETLGIKLPFLVMIIKNVPIGTISSKNILLSKFKYSTIRMYAGDFEPATISRLLEWSRLSVLCRWDWIRVGIKSSSIYLILHAGLMVVITSKLCEWLFMRTVVSAGYTFRTGFIVKRSCLLSLNCFCPFRNSSEPIKW